MVLLLGLGSAGCAAIRQPPPVITPTVSPGDRQSVSTRDWFPAHTRTTWMSVESTDGRPPADWLAHAPGSAAADASSHELSQPIAVKVTVEGQRWHVVAEGRFESHGRLDEDGGLWVEREVDHEEGVEVLYHPGVQLLAATMERGQPLHSQASVEIRRLSDGSLRESGRVEAETTWQGRRTVDLPIGRVTVEEVVTQRRMDLRFADVRVTIATAYQPGFGVVGKRIDQHVRALGLLGSREGHVQWAAPAPEGAARIEAADQPDHDGEHASVDQPAAAQSTSTQPTTSQPTTSQPAAHVAQ